jgi:murein DD-endopeptidase MepM/ murein hydrolase activator NlpD
MLRTRLALLLIAPLLASLALGAAAGAAPVDDARQERDAAQAAAVQAAQRYVDALSEQARQEAEIARLEREIPIMKARVAQLREEVRGRSVEIYKQGSPMPLERLIDAQGVVEASRALELTGRAAEHDRALARDLAHLAKKLEHDEAELKERKAMQDLLVIQLGNLRNQLELSLAAANAALDKVQAVADSQAAFAAAGATAGGQLASGASICPVEGPVAFTNDWGAPRSGGRTHKGTDIFAPYGAKDVAVVAGYVEHNLDTLGGTGILLHGSDGVVYYYAHLSKYEGPDRLVHRGEVIGYVGDTGNAKGGPPHTHFGMRPEGGEYVNPYPTLKALCLG